MEEKNIIQKRSFYNKNDSGLAFLLANIVPLIFMFVLIFVLNFANVDTKNLSDEIWYLIISALISQIAFLFSAFFVSKINKVSLSAAKLKFKIKPKIILICVIVALICFFGMYNFIGVFDYIIKKIGFVSLATTLPLENVGHLFLNIFLLGILPPICEEIVFRGIIFNGLRKSHSDIFAVVFSALLFALMHGSLEQFVFPFLMGIVFSAIVLRTGSIVSSILVHMTNNILVILFMYINNITGFSIGFSMNPLFIVLSIVIAVVAVILLFLIDKFFFKHKIHDSMQIGEKDNKELNVFMLVGIIVAVFIFIINLLFSFLA